MTSMNNSRFLVLMLIFFAAFPGCGGEKNTVITPGEDYQLTEQEQAYKEAEEEMRKGGG